ncbi:MAG: glycosyltransferase [Bacteroidetes bacterium]|nr:MAG: glycosyltransferase [Bacteroidota bacterium]
MKIILMSVGTRGDMEPFLALADIFTNKGHQVICAFPEQFRDLAETSGFEFASLGTKLIELLDSPDGRAAMGAGGSGWKKFTATLRLAVNQGEANKELAHAQYELIERENPDKIVYNGKAVYPVLWGLKNEGKTVFVSPIPYMHYVEGHTHIGFNTNLGTFLNKLTFALANFGMVTTTMVAKKWLKIKDKVSRKAIREFLKTNKSVYTISPALFPRPEHWHEDLQVLGYHERDKTVDWQPDEKLQTFLDRHSRILFVTFGSMLNTAPEEKTKAILDILSRHQIPAIINTASGGLVEPENYDREMLHFVNRIPYDWVFPKMHAVIHHGGSGTTHMALKSGCATMVIPHIIDQFAWNGIVHELGAGPKGDKVGKLTVDNLEPKILDLWNNEDYKVKTEAIGRQMRKEDFREEIYRFVIK